MQYYCLIIFVWYGVTQDLSCFCLHVAMEFESCSVFTIVKFRSPLALTSHKKTELRILPCACDSCIAFRLEVI